MEFNMKKITLISLLLISTSSYANEGGIIEIVDYIDSPDTCLVYKDGLCVLTEKQAVENMEITEEENNICLVTYKEKCILNNKQAKENFAKAKTNYTNYKKSRPIRHSPRSSSGIGYRSGSRNADLRADAMLRR